MVVRYSDKWIDRGLLIARIALGVVFVAHGWQKLAVMGYPAVTGMMTSLGIPLPGVNAALLIGAELGGGLMLLAGALTRFAGLMLLVDMIVAAITVHIAKGFFLPAGFEYTFTLGLLSLALMMTGAGRYSIDAFFAHRPHVDAGVRHYPAAA